MKFIVLFLGFSIILFANKDLEKVSLQLKWKYQFQFAGFIVAKEKGFYKNIGLDVELKEFDNSVNILQDMKSAKTQFGVSDSSLIYDVLNGSKLSAIMAIFQDSPFVLMGLKSSGIKNLQDIEQKKLALYEGINGIAAETMLKANNINYISKPPIYTLNKLLSGEIDLMTAYISNEPYIAKTRGIEVVTFSPKDYGFEEYGDILFTSQKLLKENPKLVNKMYKASYMGWEYAFSHIDEVVDLIYEKYNTLHKTRDAIKYEANQLKILSGYSENFGELNIEKIKGIGQQFNLMKKENNKLIKLDDFIYQYTNLDQIHFTKDESIYIKNKKTINVCVKNNLEPLAIKENNRYSGITIDYLNLISKSTKLDLNYIYTTNINDYINGVRDGTCDIATVVIRKPNKYKLFLTPSTPFASDSIVLATLINKPYISDLNRLKGEKIMIEKEAKSLILYIKHLYPKLNIIEVATTDLDRVADGEFYGVIESSYLLAYKIASKYPNKIKIMTQASDKRVEGSFGVSNKEPLLLSILNKAINKIPQSTKQKIINSYRTINIEKYTDYTLLWQIIVIFILILFIIYIIFLKLNKLNKTILNQKNKFQNIFENSSDGVAIITNGRFTDCNNAILKLLKYQTKEEFLTLIPADFSPKYQPDGEYSYEKSMMLINTAKEKGKNYFEWVHKKTTGEEFWTETTLTNISNDSSDVIIHVVMRDIQYRKELEQELMSLNTNLELKVQEGIEKNKEQQLAMLQQSRHAQMGEMLAIIAHQWRQPLNSLSMINQTISLKYTLGKLNNEYMVDFDQDSKEQIVQMSQTIDDFSNFFKPNKEAKVFSVNTAILNAIKLLKPVLYKHVILIEFDEKEQVVIKGFSNDLGQVIINILNNAKDVLIEKSRDEKNTIHIALEKENDTVVITIEDNGGGIADDVISKIFDPYFSTKDEKNGTGLGLYMSKSIIENYSHGTLSVKNSSKGAVFKISLGLIHE